MIARFKTATSRLLTAIGLIAATAAGQEPVSDGMLVESRWSEARSLALFEACDRDADDRLDLFEIRRALVDLGGSRDPAVLRRLDTDASGFLEWPEFDARFRKSLERAGRFRLRTARPVPTIEDPSATSSNADPTEVVIGMLDDNGDGLLSRPELAMFLRRLRQDPALVEQFPALDSDGSGNLDATEFAPIAGIVPNILTVLGANDELRRGMPQEYLSADRSLDGTIDQVELRFALIRLHPSLEQWTSRILAAADKTRNGTLGGAELVAARTKALGAIGSR